MIQKPHTYIADIAHLPKALERITLLPRWVVWRWELRTKKNGTDAWTKPPFQCRNPQASAKSNDPRTWGTYAEALDAVAAGLADGIGFMLKDSEVAAADLDHVRDAITGELIGWAKHMCLEAEQRGLYIEITVSGGGLRFIGISSGGELHRKFTFNRRTGAGIELYRNCARYITISGLQQGACEELGPIDDYFDALMAQCNAPPPNTDPFDFNTARPQGPSFDYYQHLIENGAPEGERSEKFQEVVWHLAAAGWTVEQIVDALSKHPNGIGLKYATRLLAEVSRSYTKWQGARQTAAMGAGATPGRPWPQIQIKPGELPRVVNEAEDALLLLGREIYQRGGLVVRPVLKSVQSAVGEIEAWQLIEMTRPHLVETLCCAAQFSQFDRRARKWTTVDAPDKVADSYLNRRGRWKLPRLAGIVSTPFLRRDGSVCQTPGYDVTSELLFKVGQQSFPPIPQFPSPADAIGALGLLEQLIDSFPFVTAADRSVALSALLTILDRRSMATAPLHGFSSPTAGTGKSLLVDLAAILATGRAMPVIAQGRSEEELEKRLGAALLAGDTAISLDNCDHTLESAFLCQVLTQPVLNIRLLGRSKNVETPINAMIFATGNNLVIGGDAIRRTLMCTMDAGVERPELRTFTKNILEVAKANRGELVVAALTVLRAWHAFKAAGKSLNLPAFGSFGDWSARIREPLVWLDKIDPCETLAEIRDNDPHRGELIAVIMQWKQHLILDQKYTVQELIGRAVNVPDFHNALVAVAMARTGGMISNASLGRWLKRVQKQIVNGLTLLQDGNAHGYPQWKLTRR
jgi:hypothetical protein